MVSAEVKPLPSDVDAEEAVIASIMVDDDAIFKAQPDLRPEDFYREQNR